MLSPNTVYFSAIINSIQPFTENDFNFDWQIVTMIISLRAECAMQADLLPAGADLRAVQEWLMRMAAFRRLTAIGACILSSRTRAGLPDAARALLTQRQVTPLQASHASCGVCVCVCVCVCARACACVRVCARAQYLLCKPSSEPMSVRLVMAPQGPPKASMVLTSAQSGSYPTGAVMQSMVLNHACMVL